jgi:hypothetical protein
MLKIKNRKGDLPSIMFTIVSLFVVGFLIFIITHVSLQFYGGFSDYFESDNNLNNSEAHLAIEKISAAQESIWDWVFLAIVVGYVSSLAVLSFLTRINIIFLPFYIIGSLFGLFMGVALSNTWAEMASSSEFVVTLTYFPITNFILGNFFPIFITVIMILSMVLLFGKVISSGGES